MKLSSLSKLFYILSWLSENIRIMVRSTILIEYHRGGTEANGVFIVITAVCCQSINVAVLISIARKLHVLKIKALLFCKN